jgi:hypothetical protein
MHIDLNIEELVLTGVAADDRALVAASLSRELTRLIAERGVPPSLTGAGNLANLDAGAFHLRPGERADALGTRIAGMLYQGLAHEDAPESATAPEALR